MPRIVRMLALVLLVSASLWAAPATAQEAVDPFADLGLPEIAVSITADAITVDQSEIAAGRYVLRMTNDSEEDDIGVGFLQPPDGMTAADFIANVVVPATPESTDAEPVVEEATPDVAASPEGEEDGGGPPDFFYEIPLAGGIYAMAGETASQVLDLGPGEWVVWAEDPSAPQTPAALLVTGDMPADLPTPESDVTIATVEMAFEIEGELAAGPQVIEFVNRGQQPHFIFLAKVPDGTTLDDVFALFATFEDPAATPTAGLAFEDVVTAVDTGDQSSGVTTWIAADLAAGDHLIVCFVADQETGTPHAFMGMVDIVTVA